MEIDQDGCLVNETAKENITGKWKDIVDEAIEVYGRHLGDALHSLYLRGSVARGKAIDGVSDVDTIAILNSSPDELAVLDLSWTKVEQAALHEKYPFQTRVEFYFLSKDDISFTDQFIIQSQSVCIYGEDISEGVGKILFSRSTILKLIDENKINTKIENARSTIKESDDSRKIAKMTSWIAKRFLRVGVLLAALKEPTYTRDLYPSYELFAAQYPEKADDMHQALEYAINPTKNKEESLAFIDTLGSWLIEEKARL